MALVFPQVRRNPRSVRLEISRALKSSPRLQIRMGIHSGPVSALADLTERTNVAGAGINMAQRVMDCGDAGHILVSKHVAEDLEQHDRAAAAARPWLVRGKTRRPSGYHQSLLG